MAIVVNYNLNVPDAPNDPADDQPNMKVNTNSNQTIWNVDHVAFNILGGGYHKQVTFWTKNIPAAPVDPTSVLYTDNGVASTKAQLLFVNEECTFPISALRAFATFTGVITNGSPVTINNKYNVTSITATGGNYVITLATNATAGNFVTVLLSNGAGFTQTYSFTGNVLTVSGVGFVTNLSVAILQF